MNMQESCINPFTDALAACVSSKSAESSLYAQHRDARQHAQRELLLKTPHFKKDDILARLVSSQAAGDGKDGNCDPRHSIIFIARPRGALVTQIKDLQHAITRLLQQYRVPALAIWCTPEQDLHMTLLDIVSCVPQGQVTSMLPLVAKNNLVESVHGKCTLRAPKLMVDGTALALSLLPSGSDGGNGQDSGSQDSHVKMRSDLWDACHENGTTPVMRYVAHSAHITLVRFLHDIHLSTKDMQALLDDLESLTLNNIQEWIVTRDDILFVYGQVYYGGGTIVPQN